MEAVIAASVGFVVGSGKPGFEKRFFEADVKGGRLPRPRGHANQAKAAALRSN
jgi:hypothetical protein